MPAHVSGLRIHTVASTYVTWSTVASRWPTTQHRKCTLKVSCRGQYLCSPRSGTHTCRYCGQYLIDMPCDLAAFGKASLLVRLNHCAFIPSYPGSAQTLQTSLHTPHCALMRPHLVRQPAAGLCAPGGCSHPGPGYVPSQDAQEPAAGNRRRWRHSCDGQRHGRKVQRL
jgi:hypothetical protein